MAIKQLGKSDLVTIEGTRNNTHKIDRFGICVGKIRGVQHLNVQQEFKKKQWLIQ